MSSHDDLIAALEAEQARQRTPEGRPVSNGAFAARLGISRQLWEHHRRTRAPLSRRTIDAVLREYPQFTPSVLRLFFSPADAKISTVAASAMADERVPA